MWTWCSGWPAGFEPRCRRHEGRTGSRFGTIEATARQQERDLAVRDSAVGEALTGLRVTSNSLRETTADLRFAIRAPKGARAGSTPPPSDARTTSEDR
jgi:hypothetical protein